MASDANISQDWEPIRPVPSTRTFYGDGDVRFALPSTVVASHMQLLSPETWLVWLSFLLCSVLSNSCVTINRHMWLMAAVLNSTAVVLWCSSFGWHWSPKELGNDTKLQARRFSIAALCKLIGDLGKIWILNQEVWNSTWESEFLTGSHGMPILLVRGLQFGDHGSRFWLYLFFKVNSWVDVVRHFQMFSHWMFFFS